ncbi:MAG: o-succinylbenzoate synthase [Desulfotalea sp.]
MELKFTRNDLIFKRPAGTSRGVLKTKPTWYLELYDAGKKGVGEVSLIPGLSIDDENFVEPELLRIGKNLQHKSEKVSLFLADKPLVNDLPSSAINLHNLSVILDELQVSVDGKMPAVRMALEMAFLSLQANSISSFFDNDFSCGKKSLSTNGLIWMGDAAYMQSQVEEKLAEGYSCIKLKIGAIDFASECKLLSAIRQRFSKDQIELRVDANGAFSPDDAMEKLRILSSFDLHSIEQPIKQGQWNEMATLCTQTPLPIALDEELIGVYGEDRCRMLDKIKPQYIILKPSLLGGFQYSDTWITEARKRDVGVWVTSALESNMGLRAIAEWTSFYDIKMPQGLGTGKLYTNNLPSELKLLNGYLSIETLGL